MIFDNIKQGILPTDEEILLFIKDPKIDKNEEIKKYIDILKQSFDNASLYEQIILAKLLLVLETLYGDNSLYNFLDRIFQLDLNKLDPNFFAFFDKFLEVIDEDKLFEIIFDILNEISTKDSKYLRTFFGFLLHGIWNKFYISKRFDIFYEKLKNLIYILRDKNRIADMMYVEFFTYHTMGNRFQKIEEWKKFNKEITTETIKAYYDMIPTLKKPNPSKKEKKKIAFVKPRIVFNSPYKVEYSLFKALMENEEFKNNYEIIVYSANYFEKSDDDETCIRDLEDLGVQVKQPVNYFKNKYMFYNDHLQKAIVLREAMIKDEIDIMIAGGVFPILNFLYVTRTAPLQIYYSHGNCAFDIEGIDKRISHFEQVCKEFEWNIIDVPIAKEFLLGTPGKKQVAKIIKKEYQAEFGEDVVILGTIGRLIKIDSDEYLQTISEIMQENPNTIYVACGDGNIDSIKEKLKKYNIDENRFLFIGVVEPHVYGWVIDVWPDTFPLRQGASKEEFMAKGGIVVFMEEYLNDTIKKWYKNYKTPPFAKNKKEYIELVNKFIKSKDEELSQFNKNIFNKKLDVNQCIKVIDG